ncbi:MAG TPA: hypothetical protein DDW52_21185 [Planctomycetaceae bacterium]|nr:hypothetical protein [Planctomycetaceae bacterium]
MQNTVNPAPDSQPLAESKFSGMRFPARRDLQYNHAGGVWNAFDPLTRQSVRIGSLEKAILASLDGKMLLATVARKLVRDGISSSTQAVFSAAEHLVASGLLQVDTAGNSGAGRQKRSTTGNALPALRAAQQTLGRLVVWQVRGVNPERLLAWLAPRSDMFFSRRAVLVWCLLMFITGIAICLGFHRFCVAVSEEGGTLLAASPLTSGSEAVWGGGLLVLLFLMTRAIHELSHAVVCERHSVRCPDIGLLFILFAPCVYCDVTESWRLPKRRERAAVAAAGMYAELIVATLAAWVWLLTLPSLWNTIALQLMLICSVSTILINANPLMRFDGYYILADWLDEVRLRAKADHLLSEAVVSLVLGLPRQETYDSRELHSHTSRTHYGRFLLVFSAAGLVYRCMLALAISAAVVLLFRGWELVWVGRLMGGLILFSWWGIPMLGFGSKLLTTARLSGRVSRLFLFSIGLTLIVLTLPIPTRRFGSGWVQAESSQRVFATADAQLVKCYAADGQQVAAGQPLFRLASPDAAAELVHHVTNCRSNQIQLEQARRQRNRYARDVDLESYETRLRAVEQQKEASLKRMEKLEIVAGQAGLLIAAVCPPAPDLSQWNSGSEEGPLPGDEEVWTQPRQLGRTVSRGELLATICSRGNIAVVPLSDEQLADVAEGTRCKIHAPNESASVTTARVTRVVELNTQLGRTGVTGASLPKQYSGADSNLRYAAIVKLPSASDAWPIESPIQVVFHTQSVSLFDLARNLLRRHLRFLAS